MGQQLAMVQDYNHVYLIDLNDAASLPTQIFASECLQPPDIELFWQRSGGHLLIQQQCTSLPPNEASRLELFVADLSGQLTTLTHLPSHPDSDYYLSADGGQVAYVANQHIYVAEVGGNTTERLTATPGDYGAAGSPLVWSPDGSQLAFFEGEYPFQRINVINTDGTDRRLLTPDQNFQIYRSRLLWSPDGRYLAFYRPYNPPYSNQEVISLVNVSSGEIRPISLPGFYSELNWSPDSRQLSVAGGTQFEQQLLYVVNIDTGRFTQLTPEPFHRIPGHAWAPQGDWLAFTATPLGVELASPVLYVVRPDGTDLSALTTGNEYVFPFAWRPMP
jgi:Tol biopolymer transport system component